MRERLPDRRPSETVTIQSRHQGGRKLHLTTGFYEDGRLGELFVHGAKIGSHTDMMLAEVGALLSIALQHGMPLEEFATNVQRETDGKPATTVGEIIDALAARKG